MTKEIKHYRAEITPLNEQIVESSAHGIAEISESANEIHVKIEMFDTPANIEHWEHFHGFPDGRQAKPATMAQDVNNDGIIDLIETGAVSGTTMVPFDQAPADMNIPNDTYPVADSNGHYVYEQTIPAVTLKHAFKEAFGTDKLQFDRRVLYVHGIPKTTQLPTSVAGAVGEYGADVTLPIAVGQFAAVN